MTNIVMVRQGFKNYLFNVPMGTTLKKDDKVVCDTARGEQEGICFTDSFIVEADALKQIALLTGATFPLKSVIGKSEIVRFKDKTQENKFKVGEKYKVNIAFPIEGGDIIEITDKQGLWYYYKTISGTHTPDISTAFSEVSSFAKCLTPYTETETVKKPNRYTIGNINLWSGKTIKINVVDYTPTQEPTKEPEKHTYKNGDYVKIISNAFNNFEVGYVVKLNYKVNNGWWNCSWTGFEDSLTSYVSEDEFEPFEMGGIK